MPPQGWLEYRPGFWPTDVADVFFEGMMKSLDWAQRPIRLFGRDVLQPRLTALEGDPGVAYHYSGKTLVANAWSAELADIRDQLVELTGVRFNSVLCNLYRTGADTMGWHADDEPELGPSPLIASVSLGATRRFSFRSRADHAVRHELSLDHGSLLLMGGDIQHHWQHQLPRARAVTQPRINLTFRAILDRPAAQRPRRR